MAESTDPIVDQWYHYPQKSEKFQVTAIDEASETVEIQYFDGNIDEFELSTWYELEIEPIATPADWTGPLDNIEKDDLTPVGTEMSSADWQARAATPPGACWRQIRSCHRVRPAVAPSRYTAMFARRPAALDKSHSCETRRYFRARRQAGMTAAATRCTSTCGMVFSHDMYGACLQTVLTEFFREPDFVADLERIEITVDDTVAVKINIGAVRSLDTTAVLPGRHFTDFPMRRHFMSLDLAPLFPGMVLQFPADRVKGIAQRDVGIFMGMMFFGPTLHHQFTARHGYIDPDVKQVALMVMTMRRFYHHAAGHDPVMKLIELGGFLANIRLECFGMKIIAKRNL
jgi:hypothetical protein